MYSQLFWQENKMHTDTETQTNEVDKRIWFERCFNHAQQKEILW